MEDIEIIICLVAVALITFITIGLLHCNAVKTLPDGRQYVTVNYNTYWLEKWPEK